MMTSNDWFVAPNLLYSKLPKPITLDVKIEIFKRRVNGWKLDIADYLINGINDTSGVLLAKAHPNSAFAVLDILLSYFEMIAKYQDGYTCIGKSRIYFKKGLHTVFPELIDEDQLLVEKFSNVLYEGARCGMYHIGFPDSHIFLEGGDSPPIVFRSNGEVTINPHKLVLVVKIHFNNYIEQLKDVNNSKIRKNFENRFDKDTSQ